MTIVKDLFKIGEASNERFTEMMNKSPQSIPAEVVTLVQKTLSKLEHKVQIWPFGIALFNWAKVITNLSSMPLSES